MKQSVEAILALDHSFPSRFEPHLPEGAKAVGDTIRTYYIENLLAGSVKNQKKFLSMETEELFLLMLADACEERYQVACAFYMYFFFLEDFTDRMDEDAALKVFERTIGILKGTQEPDVKNPMEVVLNDLVSTLASIGDASSREVARIVLEASCALCVSFGNHKDRQRSMLDFESYKEYRFIDSGAGIALQLVDWAYSVNLPFHMRSDPDIVKLRKTTGIQASLLNDLYSYRVEALRAQHKDSTAAEYLYNCIPVIMQQEAIDTQSAMDYLKIYLFDLEDSFLETLGVLKTRYSGEDRAMAIRLARAYENLMAGSWMWSTYCGRYQPSNSAETFKV